MVKWCCTSVAHRSPNYEPTNSERNLVCGNWHPSENTGHPTYFPFLRMPSTKGNRTSIYEKWKSLGWLVLVGI